jgi:hypothetical protein
MGVTTAGTRPAQPAGASARTMPPPAADALPPYDELLAARLAGGLQRLEWLGASLERLLRRLVARPGA